MIRTLTLSALLVLLAAPAFAQDAPPAPEPTPAPAAGLQAGDDAADFTPRNWINPPSWESFAELKGDVVLIKAWGIK